MSLLEIIELYGLTIETTYINELLVEIILHSQKCELDEQTNDDDECLIENYEPIYYTIVIIEMKVEDTLLTLTQLREL